MGPLARRVAFARVVLVVVTALTYATPRILRPVILIESVFSVPGFFENTWKALGHVDPPERPDFPMLQAITVWSTAFIVVLGILTDAVLPWLDPRLRRSD